MIGSSAIKASNVVGVINKVLLYLNSSSVNGQKTKVNIRVNCKKSFMVKVYKTYETPPNPFIIQMICLVLLFAGGFLGMAVGLVNPILAIAVSLIALILLMFVFHRYFTYTDKWVRMNVKCPICEGSMSKTGEYEGSLHVRFFALRCGKCKREFALTLGSNKYVLQDSGDSFKTSLLRATYVMYEILGLLVLFAMFCVLIIYLIFFLLMAWFGK